MEKRAPVQGWPFVLVHARAANTHHLYAGTEQLSKPTSPKLTGMARQH